MLRIHIQKTLMSIWKTRLWIESYKNNVLIGGRYWVFPYKDPARSDQFCPASCSLQCPTRCLWEAYEPDMRAISLSGFLPATRDVRHTWNISESLGFNLTRTLFRSHPGALKASVGFRKSPRDVLKALLVFTKNWRCFSSKWVSDAHRGQLQPLWAS